MENPKKEVLKKEAPKKAEKKTVDVSSVFNTLITSVKKLLPTAELRDQTPQHVSCYVNKRRVVRIVAGKSAIIVHGVRNLPEGLASYNDKRGWGYLKVSSASDLPKFEAFVNAAAMIISELKPKKAAVKKPKLTTLAATPKPVHKAGEPKHSSKTWTKA